VDAQREVNMARQKLVIAQAQKLMDVVQLFSATAADWRPAPTA
jgi:outer membrane protein TolC